MDYQPTTPVERCTAHEGAHALYLGHCYAFGAQVERPTRWRGRPVYCPECGGEMDALKLPEGRVVLLTAGTDRRHHHPPREAPRVEIDVDGLAEAIVRASRATREERRPAQPSAPAPAAPATPAQPNEPSIPTVTVWSPGMDDGRSD